MTGFQTRWESAQRYLLLAVFSYLPLLVAAPNKVGADTKQFLYLNPADLMQRAISLWDQSVGGGSVTHQTIGYLWPMGPFFWFFERLGIPDWVAQRFWIGSIIFTAAAGALYLLDQVFPKRWVNVVGAVLYGFSPYVLGHVTGQSALLLPFSAFPYLVAFMGLAVRRGGWRWPAAFALVVTTAGSLNGSSVFFVVLGAVLWAPMLVASTPEISWRNAVGAVARAGVLTLVTQLWWLVAYQVGGAYGLPILAMTETIEVTSATTTAPEILRGLGYWFFYGSDRDGPWLNNIAPLHTTNLIFLAVSFLAPIATILVAPFVRFKERLFFVLLTVVGLTVSVGAYNASGRSPYGAAFYKLADLSPLVMSLRNTQRATPLLLLGLAGILTAALHALSKVVVRSYNVNVQRVVAGAMVAALAVSFPSFWITGLVGERFHRGNEVPRYWHETAAALDAGSGRYWELPGIDFASYRWGHTLDPVLAGLTNRPGIWRELIPSGSPAAADLVGALDRTIQDGTFQPAALAPVARLLGVSEVVLRSDLEYERYRTMRPQRVWEWFRDVPKGLANPSTFGEGYSNRAPERLPMIDELELALDPQASSPPAVAVFPVVNTPQPVRAVSSFGGTVIAGSGDGVVAAAAAGLLDDVQGPIRYAAEVTSSERTLNEAIRDNTTTLIITDSNRLRGQHWFSLKDNVGAIEIPGNPAIPNDESDARLLPVEPTSERSLSIGEFRGAKNVWATGYGNPITLTPEYRAVNAFDGDFNTAWMMSHGVTNDPSIIGIELDKPLAPSQIWLRQETNNPGWRRIHQVELTFDNSRTLRVDLDETSLSGQGQLIELDGQDFTTFELQVLSAEPGSGRVGFSEITIPGVVVEELVHLPTDLIAALDTELYSHPLRVVLNRLWVDPSDVVRADPEERISRVLGFTAPIDLTLAGEARLSPQAPEELIDRLVGIPTLEAGGFVFRSSAHLASSLESRAAAAFDGNTDTAWTSVFGQPTNSWLQVVSADEITLETFNITLVNDGHHSVPTKVAIEVDGQYQDEIELPDPADPGTVGAASNFNLELDRPLVGHDFKFIFSEVSQRTTTDWYSGQQIVLPLGVVEIEIPGHDGITYPAQLDESCRYDLVSLNGQPIGVKVQGETTQALAGQPFQVNLCEETFSTTGVEDIIRSAPGRESGFNIDQLVLANEVSPITEHQAVPEVKWNRSSSSSFDVSVGAWEEPVWLVIDESWNKGWHASVNGESLGEPQQHDLWGMGWWIEPNSVPTEVEIRWTPQRAVNVALAVSGLAVVLCVGLIVIGSSENGRFSWHRRKRSREPEGGLATNQVTDQVTTQASIDVVPEFEFARSSHKRSITWPMAIFGGLTATALVSVWWGLGLFMLLALGRWKPKLWPGLGVLPALMVAISAAYIVLLQWRWRYPVESMWPEHFERVHQLTFSAVILMALLAVANHRSGRDTKLAE